MAIELRVHGVSGSPVEAELDRPWVGQVAGDGDSGFYRPRPEIGGTTGPGGAVLEGYRWGSLTSGAAARALWLLLLPFMLANLALWLRPIDQSGSAASGAAHDPDRSPSKGSPGAYRTIVRIFAATASNPLTIASWAAIFSAASVGHVADTTADAAALLVGIGVGSFAWFAVLSTVTGRLIRRRVSPRALRTADIISGSGIAAFGLLLGWRTARSAQ